MTKEKEKEKEKGYCGFVCSDVVDKAREIKAELDDFDKYNPEEAKVVRGNVLKALVGDDVKELIESQLCYNPDLISTDEYADLILQKLGIKI